MMRAIGVLVVVVSVGLASTAWAETEAEKQADKLFVEGRELLKKGDQASAQLACEKFHAANALDTDAPGVMLNLGLCYEALKKTATALKWYRRAQTAASEAKPQATEFEEAAKERKKDLASQVATIKIDVTAVGAEVEIRVDGERKARNDLASPVEVDQGAHKVEASAPGKATYVEEFTINDGERDKAISIPELKPAPVAVTPSKKMSRRKLGLAIGIPSVVLGITIPFAADALQDHYNANNRTPSSAPALMIVMGSVWGVALAGVVVGGYFVFKPQNKERITALVPTVSPDHLGVAYLGRF